MQVIRSLVAHTQLLKVTPFFRSDFCGHSRQLTLTSINMGSKKALVIIADGSEEIEAVTPIDVFRRAGVEVSVAGLLGKNPVVCSRNITIVPDGSLVELSSHGQIYDVIILPGGLKGAEAFAASPEVGKLLKDQESAGEGRLIGAICAAPMALKSHGIFPGKSITSYPSLQDEITEGTTYNYQQSRVVIDGRLITSRGPGTALEFSLAIVGLLCGQEKATEIGKTMLDIGSVNSA